MPLTPPPLASLARASALRARALRHRNISDITVNSGEKGGVWVLWGSFKGGRMGSCGGWDGRLRGEDGRLRGRGYGLTGRWGRGRGLSCLLGAVGG